MFAFLCREQETKRTTGVLQRYSEELVDDTAITVVPDMSYFDHLAEGAGDGAKDLDDTIATATTRTREQSVGAKVANRVLLALLGFLPGPPCPDPTRPSRPPLRPRRGAGTLRGLTGLRFRRFAGLLGDV